MMRTVLSTQFRDELRDWIMDNKRIAVKIFDLIKAIEQNPYEGVGKPEPLRHNLSGFWSRRIDQEHRLVYEVNEEGNYINFLSCKGHYN